MIHIMAQTMESMNIMLHNGMKKDSIVCHKTWSEVFVVHEQSHQFSMISVGTHVNGVPPCGVEGPESSSSGSS